MKSFSVLKMAVALLPVSLRRPTLFALARPALFVLQSCHDNIFDTHCGEPYGTYYRLARTGQVCVLESLLNDRHDPALRRISIGGGDSRERPYIYTEGEITAQPHLRTWTDTADLFLHPAADYAGCAAADFIVRVPRALAADEPNIRASTDDMKIAGTLYAIQYF